VSSPAFSSRLAVPGTGSHAVSGPAQWGKLGLDKPAVPEPDVTAMPGDPRVLQQVVDDFAYLRDTAWSVHQGLDALMTMSESGFQGETADALRNAVSGRLQRFIYNIARAFSLAGEAVAEYRLVLATAQQRVSGMASQASGPAAEDPGLGGLKKQVEDEKARVQDAEAVMVRALQDAAEMVSQPVKMPSLFDTIWQRAEVGLGITAMALMLLSTLVDGPLGVMGFAAAAAGVGMSGVDLARHRTNAAGLLLSITALLFPETKGLFSLRQLGAGLRVFAGALGKVGAKTVGVLSSRGAMWAFGVGSVRGAAELLPRIPELAVEGIGRGGSALWSGLEALPGIVKGAPEWLEGVISQDFERVVKRYPELVSALGTHLAYPLVTVGRVLGALFTPMRFSEMAELGFRQAWQAWQVRALLTGTWRELGAGWRGAGVREAAKSPMKSELLTPLLIRHGGPDAGAGAAGHILAEPLPAPEPLLAPEPDWAVHGVDGEEFTSGKSGLLLPPALAKTKEADGWGAPALNVDGREALEMLRGGTVTKQVVNRHQPQGPQPSVVTMTQLTEDVHQITETVPLSDGPEPDAVLPESDVARPEPDAARPEPEAVRPEPDVARPELDAARVAALVRVVHGDTREVLDIVQTETLIAAAWAVVHETSQDPHALLQGARRLRRAAYQRLLHQAQQAVREFSSTLADTGTSANLRTNGAFTVTAVDGHPDRYAALHRASGLRTVLDSHGRWISREYQLGDPPGPLEGMTVVVTRAPRSQISPISPRRLWASALSYRLAGDSRLTARYEVAPVRSASARMSGTYQSAFIVTDLATGDRHAFAAEGTYTICDVWVGDEGRTEGLGYLRYRNNTDPVDALPALVDARGVRLAGVRVEAHADAPQERELRLVPAPGSDAPRERLVVQAASGALLDAMVAIRSTTGQFGNGYWGIYRSGLAVRTDASGRVVDEWPNARIEVGDGHINVADPTTGETIWWRPFLGHGHGDERISRWLTHTGTVRRLPFGRSGTYSLPVPFLGRTVPARIGVPRAGLHVQRRNRNELVNASAEFFREGEQLMVQFPVSSLPDRAPAEFLFNGEGTLVGQEWPLAVLGNWPDAGEVRVLMYRTTARDPWHYGLAGPLGHTARFRVEALTLHQGQRLIGERSAGGPPFVISERATGIRRYYVPFLPSTIMRWEVPLDERTGLRLVAPYGNGVPAVRNATGRDLTGFSVRKLTYGTLAVAQDFHVFDPNPDVWLLDDVGGPAERAEHNTPLMDGPLPDLPLIVDGSSLRVYRPTRTEPDANGVTAWFPLPDAPDGITAEYRFNREGLVLREDIPLVEGPEEVGALRLVGQLIVGEDGPTSIVYRLRGTAAPGFSCRPFDVRDPMLRATAPGFTILQHSTGILRHYGPGNRLLYRDLPTWNRACYVRIGVGPKQGTLAVVDKRGRVPANWRAEWLDDGRVAMIHTAWDDMPQQDRPLTRLLFDPVHGLVEEILGIPRQDEDMPSLYWKFGYIPPRVALVDAAGREVGGKPKGIRLVASDLGIWMIVDPQGKILFRDREQAIRTVAEMLDSRPHGSPSPGPEFWAEINPEPGGEREAGPPAAPTAAPAAQDAPAQDVPAQDVPADERVTDVPLPGPELAGLRLRVIETEAGPEAAPRLELRDFRTPSHQLGWNVHERRDGDGGYLITDDRGNRRWYLTPEYGLEFRDVRLPRTGRFVRFRPDGSASIVGPAGVTVEDEYVLEPSIDPRTWRETGLTVRLAERAPLSPGTPLAWRIDGEQLPQIISAVPQPYMPGSSTAPLQPGGGAG
jgi:hypothetical protein